MGKWNWKSFAVGATAGGLLFSGISYAAPLAVKMVVDGREVRSEVPAQIIDGSTMIPARALAEALGAEVGWDQATQTVTIKSGDYRTVHAADKPGFGAQAAVVIAGEAQRHNSLLNRGGAGAHEAGAAELFKVQDKPYDYRWMGSDQATKAKYIAYLEEVFTPEQASAYWDKQVGSGSIAEVNGRLAQPNADGGNIIDWSDAKGVFVEDGADRKTFRLTVSDVNIGTERLDLHVKFVEGKGWRVDDPVETYH